MNRISRCVAKVGSDATALKQFILEWILVAISGHTAAARMDAAKELIPHPRTPQEWSTPSALAYEILKNWPRSAHIGLRPGAGTKSV